MAKLCDQCGRGSAKATNRSHSNIATLRRQYINLQTKHIDGTKVKLCTSCIRTNTKKATA
ncbi:50S ribosomal protein L28 [Candidatus Uhrbacteria bacterium CG10_big_fil_rev_8_21_14_0_10_48_11]|uniref:50S ribosomal protein L28 n=1 Tax=Candidatus Uhrbacteria bacterium CG10_big_fil_rev_8_21_14_0_10_48_11 TaxID=1975037 RepID=A0A2M8LF72_9BACT|nr:MAG: 50S ribosomal protein L28 [Candidatus Uhrbacteria bacterium CG10_big_fil_rev_8_21_14_0_10_48_11]